MKRYIVSFFCVFALILSSFSAFAEKNNDPLNTLSALNNAVFSINRVVNFPTKVTVEEEYNNIINNMAVGNIFADLELTQLYKDMMDAYTENRLEDKDRDLLRKQYEAQVNRAFLDVKPISHIQTEATVQGGRAIANSLSGDSPWYANLFKVGTAALGAYGDYQIALQANERVRQQARGQEQEYMAQRLSGEWQLDKEKIRRFNKLRSTLLEAAWVLLNKYDLPDEARITEENLDQYYRFISEKDAQKAIRMGKRLEETFSQFPQFWFHLGSYYLQEGDPKEARKCFERFEEINRPIFRRDPLAAANARYKIFTLDADEKKEAARLVDIVEKQSANDDWNNILFAALQNYQLGRKDKALDLVQRNIDNEYNVPLNQEIYQQLKNDKVDLNAVQGVAIREFREPTELEKLAKEGNAEAQMMLGEGLYYTYGPKNMEAGIQWLEKSADQGHPIAKCLLANIQFKDPKYKQKWLQEAPNIIKHLVSKADSSGQADNCLGLFYGQGIGVEKDDKEAVKYYQNAADKGFPWGFSNLGLYYVSGRGVPKDIERSLKFMEKAAEYGNSTASYYLGNLYSNGKIAKKDLPLAFDYFKRAAELGNIRAAYSLAYMYEEGIGVKKDVEKALYWYEKAASQEHNDSLMRLGFLYRTGKGVKKDIDKALSYYQLASDRGYAPAYGSLGAIYESGEGVAKDITKAVEYYKKGVEKGDATSQNNLGLIYAEGQGVPKDLAKAKELLTLAANQGNATAKKNLESVTNPYSGSRSPHADAARGWHEGADAFARGNRARAKIQWCRACQGGSKAACIDLKKHFGGLSACP